MGQETVINYVVGIVVLSALTVGLISMLFGKILDLWDSFCSWWGQGVQKAIHTRPIKARHMSSRAPVPAIERNDSSRRSYAVEQGSEQAGSDDAFRVPALWEQLEQLSDDELLDILARVKDANGNPKFADSRIAKFIGGRVEDRTNQVRDVRGSAPPPPKPPAVLRVRDNGHERLIAKYGK
jgi:hypothetical protein